MRSPFRDASHLCKQATKSFEVAVWLLKAIIPLIGRTRFACRCSRSPSRHHRHVSCSHSEWHSAGGDSSVVRTSHLGCGRIWNSPWLTGRSPNHSRRSRAPHSILTELKFRILIAYTQCVRITGRGQQLSVSMTRKIWPPDGKSSALCTLSGRGTGFLHEQAIPKRCGQIGRRT